MDSSNVGSNASDAATALAAETSSDSWEDPDEVDHLLNYFLSNDSNQSNINNHVRGEANPKQQDVVKNLRHPSEWTKSFTLPNSSHNSMPGNINQMNFIPGTPSVHFYGNSAFSEDKASSSKHQTSSSSSLPSLAPLIWTSSSSLSSICPQSANTSLPPEQPQNLGMSNGVAADQMLMLPPPPRLPNISTSHTGSGPHNEQTKIGGVSPSHIEWLNHMNSLARQAGNTEVNAVDVFMKSDGKDESSLVQKDNFSHNPAFLRGDQSQKHYYSSTMAVNSNPMDISSNNNGNSTFSSLVASIAEHQEQNKQWEQQQQQQFNVMLQAQKTTSQLMTPTLVSPYSQQKQFVQLSSSSSDVAHVKQGITSNQTFSAVTHLTNETANSPKTFPTNNSMIPSKQMPSVSTTPPLATTNAVSKPKASANLIVESEEKRARRLARNRESARLSRRRKKEHLESLSEKVNQLHNVIETKRREVINRMESELPRRREKELIDLASLVSGDNRKTEKELDNDEKVKKLSDICHSLSPSCSTRRAVTSFQYNLLRQLILPNHHQFMLWLTYQPENFFTTAKVQRPKAPGRVSSKQIGEELTSMHSLNKSGKSMLSCNASDPSLSWPLFAYELMLSVEQEEKVLQAHKKLQEEKPQITDELKKQRSHIASAMTIVANLKKNMQYRSHLAEHRSEHALLSILRPEQTLSLISWLRDEKNHANLSLAKKVLQREVSGAHIDVIGKSGSTDTNTTGGGADGVEKTEIASNEKSADDGAIESGDGDGDDLEQLCRTLSDTLKVDF